MAPGDVLYEKDGQLAIITINRPHRMNALTMAGWTYEMAEIWEDFQNDRALRVAILTAVGDRAFCAGVDVKETAERNAAGEKRDPDAPGVKASPWQNGVRKPVICAVNGIVGGGGLMLVADSDIVICNENAAFFNPGVGVGIAAMVGQVLWAKSISFHANMRIALMGPHERIDAQRAYELGIVTEVVRDKPLLDRAKEIAETMLRNSPAAMMAAKAILWNALEHGYTAAQEGQSTIGRTLSGHHDQIEGPKAFAEKRKPNWADPG